MRQTQPIRYLNAHFADVSKEVTNYTTARAKSLQGIEEVDAARHPEVFAGTLLQAIALSMWHKQAKLVGDWFDAEVYEKQYAFHEYIQECPGFELMLGRLDLPYRTARPCGVGVLYRWWWIEMIGALRDSEPKRNRESEWVYTYPNDNDVKLCAKVAKQMDHAEGFQFKEDGETIDDEYKPPNKNRPAIQDNDALEDARCAVIFGAYSLVAHLTGKQVKLKEYLGMHVLKVMRKICWEKRQNRPAPPGFYYTFGSVSNKDGSE